MTKGSMSDSQVTMLGQVELFDANEVNVLFLDLKSLEQGLGEDEEIATALEFMPSVSIRNIRSVPHRINAS